jgi:hypothetical protein
MDIDLQDMLFNTWLIVKYKINYKKSYRIENITDLLIALGGGQRQRVPLAFEND